MLYTCFNSIEKNNCSTNKNVMIIMRHNARHCQCVPLSATYSQPLPKIKRYSNKTLAHITGQSKLYKNF